MSRAPLGWVSHFRSFYFFASKRNKAKQKPFCFLFASFCETKKYIFRFVSLQFLTSIFSFRFASFPLNFSNQIFSFSFGIKFTLVTQCRLNKDFLFIFKKYSYAIPVVQSQLFHPSCPIPAYQSQLFHPSCPIPADQSQLFNLNCSIMLFSPAVQYKLFNPSWSIPAVQSRCSISPVQSKLFNLSFQSQLFNPSCSTQQPNCSISAVYSSCQIQLLNPAVQS